GALVSLLTAPFALAASVGCFLASFLAIGRIGAGAPPAVRQARSIRAGLRFVLGEPVLRAVGIASALFQVAFAAQLTVYVLFLPRTLHLSGAEIGLVMAALGPGAIAGSLLSARLPPRYGYGTVMVSAAAIGEAVLLAVPALHGSSVLTVMALAAVNVVFGACGQLVDVSVMTVRQARTPVAIQGRVVATINFVGMGLMPLGSLAAGYLAAALGIRTALLLTTFALLLSPLYMAVSPLRKLGGHEVFSAQT
ncbi:MAG: MFS transporter, partial [Nonomuraea sp.]|nr:MFS transporter [Nonomuraea sp.]